MKRDWLFSQYISWTLALPLIAALLLINQTEAPERLDRWLYDALITAYPAAAADDLVIVGIDEQSLEQIGRWPWPRSVHGELVRKLDQAGARTIVFDVLFPEPSPEDHAFAAAMAEHQRVVLALHLAPPASNRLITDVLPARPLTEAAAALGHAHVELDTDGLARGLYLYNGLSDRLWPSLGLAAHQLNSIATPTGAEPAEEAAPFINVRRDFVAVPLAGRAGTLPTESYVEVLNNPPRPERFAGKTVFVGATAAGFGDVLPTPFSGHADPMSGVEFHASAYSALKTDALIHRLEGSIRWWLPALVLLLLSISLPRLRPSKTLSVCLGLAAALMLAMAAALLFGGVHVPVAMALLMPVLAFPVWSARRLSMTNQFLNRQLDALGRGRQLNLSEPASRHPAQLLEHLRHLLQARGWWLSDGDDVLSCDNLTAQDRPSLPVPGRWVHLNNQSWIRLQRGSKSYDLGLLLPHSLTREASQRYLERLALANRRAALRPHQIRENISGRIERVRQATERLNSMQAFISRSFERMPDGIIVADALAIIQFTNGHIEEWFGEPRPSLIGMSLTRLLQGHDPRETPPWHKTVSETLTLQQSRTVDLRVRGKDFLIHFAPFDLPDSHQSGIIANIADISELRAQQRQHREAIDFISHDVRSPLVSQLALIEQLKRSPQAIEAGQLDQLGRLARRSYQLAEEFVQLARAEQLTETRFYECEFLAIVENARDSVSEQAAEKGIRLQLLGNEDIWLSGNAELLERAVINLLTNAVQYSDSGSTVTIQVFEAGHQACLTVSDEGVGIAPDELPYLFDRYRRQKSSELSGNHGAGLGLSFVNVVVEKHRGEIKVESEEGAGSTFTLKLPVAAPRSPFGRH
ncbi:MAG: CHASE2 domain-containing protein [Marinobacter sp.]|uniref:CHASE2 domain-containing protein n=1 Tax=Marinobacter sp. TaxID=50741 RepID=UPI00299D5EF8|nr:CHASE2 domain-containing protein [Marinobacter sp.]MDX1633620.1 CHASE2 domain-containing protein [Marinobacter sp.]